MAESARVASIEALREFRDALGVFVEEARQAVGQADADVARGVREVGENLSTYWDAELRRRHDSVVKRKVDLEQARWSKPEGHSLVEERKALSRAQALEQEAEAKAASCKSWGRRLEKERMTFRGQMEPLRRYLEGEAPRAMRRLEELAKRLDEYVLLAGPAAAGGAVDEAAGGSARATSGRDAGDTRGAGRGRGSDDADGAGEGADAADGGRGDREIDAVRASAPSEDDVRTAVEATADERVLPRQVLTMEQRRVLARLGGPALDLRTTVAVRTPISDGDTLVHHRVGAVDDRDSGWRVYRRAGFENEAGVDATDDGARVVRVATLGSVRAMPTLAEVWRLPVGWTVVTGPNGLVSVHDPSGERRWPRLAD
jgi:hypothetical protein